ncbi:MAG: hypothetical protein OXH69_10750 [Acidobacteria bacterium]|nr:hypothetical protein [Acidobacteriota bacterium]
MVEGMPVLMPITRERDGPARGQIEHVRAMILGVPTAQTFPGVQYPGVYVPDTQMVVPTHEGTIADGSVVDQHGDPELMLSFAEQYLSAYRALMPTGRLPTSVVEVMPALHLLVVAAELAMKADLMRSDKHTEGHSLKDLFKNLDGSHRGEARRRFANCEPNERLRSVGGPPQSISVVLSAYGASYGGGSQVYLDTRYYAEPTTKLKESPGGSLSKANTPYPIFLPYAVGVLIETFRFFDGAARLARLGAKVARGARADVDNNHGDWGLVPSSLGLIVVQVPQNARLDARHDELPEFRRWKEVRPPGFSVSWMYGGSELLFYRLDERAPDSMRIGNIECRLWRDESLGMHSRDLYKLADVLDANPISNTLRV